MNDSRKWNIRGLTWENEATKNGPGNRGCDSARALTPDCISEAPVKYARPPSHCQQVRR